MEKHFAAYKGVFAKISLIAIALLGSILIFILFLSTKNGVSIKIPPFATICEQPVEAIPQLYPSNRWLGSAYHEIARPGYILSRTTEAAPVILPGGHGEWTGQSLSEYPSEYIAYYQNILGTTGWIKTETRINADIELYRYTKRSRYFTFGSLVEYLNEKPRKQYYRPFIEYNYCLTQPTKFFELTVKLKDPERANHISIYNGNWVGVDQNFDNTTSSIRDIRVKAQQSIYSITLAENVYYVEIKTIDGYVSNSYNIHLNKNTILSPLISPAY